MCVCVRCSLTIKLGTGFICDSYHSLCTYRERTAIELVERRGRGGGGVSLQELVSMHNYACKCSQPRLEWHTGGPTWKQELES